jgi:hypothetical protein
MGDEHDASLGRPPTWHAHRSYKWLAWRRLWAPMEMLGVDGNGNRVEFRHHPIGSTPRESKCQFRMRLRLFGRRQGSCKTLTLLPPTCTWVPHQSPKRPFVAFVVESWHRHFPPVLAAAGNQIGAPRWYSDRGYFLMHHQSCSGNQPPAVCRGKYPIKVSWDPHPRTRPALATPL